MEQNSSSGAIVVVVLITGIWIWSLYGDINKLENENSNLEDYLYSCETSLDNYQSALEEANNNIDGANSIIEDAQSYAWSSYQEMGEALDNLMTVDTISEP